MSSRSLPAAERDICLQARRGHAIYFAFLVPLSAAFEIVAAVVFTRGRWMIIDSQKYSAV